MLSAASASTGDPPLYSSNTATTTQIWTVWNQQYLKQYTGGAAGTSGLSDMVWQGWVTNSVAATNATAYSLQAINNQQIWTTWVQLQGPGTLSQSVNYPPQSEEDRARQREQLARAQTEEKEANERAAELLLAYLTDDQKRTWKEKNVIDLVSERKKRYRIKRGVSHNVVELNSAGKEITSFCAHPDGVPVDDVVLTQLLALKYAEDHFLRVANKRQLAA